MVDFSKIFADIAKNNKDEFFDYIIDKDIGVAGRVAINHMSQDRLRAFVKRKATEYDKKTEIKFVLDYRKIILDEYIRDKMTEILLKEKVGEEKVEEKKEEKKVEKVKEKVVEKVKEKVEEKVKEKVEEKKVEKVEEKKVEKVEEKKVEKVEEEKVEKVEEKKVEVEKVVEKVEEKKNVVKRKVDKILRSDDVMPLKKRVRKSQSSESEEEWVEPKIHSKLGRWSNKDEKILADYLNSHSSPDVDFEHLEKTLDRSYESVSRKINKMVRNGKVDIPLNEGKRWSEKDEKILTDHIKSDTDVDFEYLEKILGRSRGSINRKIRKMIDVNSTHLNEGKRWSDEDVKVLTEHLNLYTDVNFIYLKRVLGRSRGSIHRKMGRIEDNDNIDP